MECALVWPFINTGPTMDALSGTYSREQEVQNENHVIKMLQLGWFRADDVDDN